MLIDHKSDDNGGHAGVHHVGISSIVISMLIDDTLMLVTVKFLSVVSTRYSTLDTLSFDEVLVDQQQLNVRMGVAR